ncbi:MAG: signal peptidase I [Clostridia bacterium]|nr:signal peptidase I [Clostridia bacterium]
MSIQRSPAPSTEEKQKKSLLREASSLLLMLLCAAALVFLLQAYVVQFIRVDGTSMTNTLQNGEIMLISKLDHSYQRNDIVVCHYPNRLDGDINLGASLALSRHTIFVKRLVALPGDTVAITDGKLYVNGAIVPDPEYMGSAPRDYPLRTLGEDEYFVIGDNRFSSHDSRAGDVGPIGLSMLRGKVKYVIWPLTGIRRVE